MGESSVVRVISGSARGLRLRVPKGNKTRPTADRVKETIFNLLTGIVPGASVLDLFAGSGALGIEALSRGARWATFFERDREALTLIRDNLVRSKLVERATLICATVPSKRPVDSPAIPFDLVFLDPPYEQNLVTPTLCWLEQSGVLSPGARIVVEHSAKEEMPSILQNLKPSRQKHFKETTVTLLEHT